jgi:hypothetical protein
VVKVDSLVRTSAEALRAQFEAAHALTTSRSDVNRTLRALDAVKAQLDERRKLARQVGDAAARDLAPPLAVAEASLKEALAPLVRPEGVPSYAVGPRITERLDGLFGDVDAGFAAPTAAQQAYFRELQEETRQGLAKAKEFLSGLGGLNEALARAQLPAVVALQVQ